MVRKVKNHIFYIPKDSRYNHLFVQDIPSIYWSKKKLFIINKYLFKFLNHPFPIGLSVVFQVVLKQ